MLHFFRVTLSLCCTFFVLHYLNVALLSSCTVFIFFFFFFFMLQTFYPELSSWCTYVAPFFVLHSFHVAPFFLLGSFHVAHFFLLGSFHVAPFFFCISFPVALFSSCNIFMLHFFQFGPSLLTCFLFHFMVPFFRCFSSHCALFTIHSFHVAHLFIPYDIISCCGPFPCSTFLMLCSFHMSLSQSVGMAAILKLLLIMQSFHSS